MSAFQFIMMVAAFFVSQLFVWAIRALLASPFQRAWWLLLALEGQLKHCGLGSDRMLKTLAQIRVCILSLEKMDEGD